MVIMVLDLLMSNKMHRWMPPSGRTDGPHGFAANEVCGVTVRIFKGMTPSFY
jgi:hypothetical protein